MQNKLEIENQVKELREEFIKEIQRKEIKLYFELKSSKDNMF